MSEGKSFEVGSQSWLADIIEGNTIHIDKFEIVDNIIKWEATNRKTKMSGRYVIQISCIAYVLAGKMKNVRFPIPALLLALVGIVLSFIYGGAAIMLLLLGMAWIGVWAWLWISRQNKRVLTIYTSSGNALEILFYDEKFLQSTLKFLEELLKKGRTGKQSFTVNIKGCKITKSSILEGAGIQ